MGPVIKMPVQLSAIMLKLEGKFCLGLDETSPAAFLIRVKPSKHQNFETENLRES